MTRPMGNTQPVSSTRPKRSSLSAESLRMIGIPRNLLHSTIGGFDTFGEQTFEEVKRFVSQYIEEILINFDNNRGIYLHGSNGVGKTYLASVIIKEAYRHRFSAYRVTFADYIRCYTRCWDARGVEERDALEADLYKWKAAEFLALEELGKEVDSSVTTPILEDLVRYREDKGLPLIICTNMKLKVLREHYGESVFSLLAGNMTSLKIEGADQRMRYFNKRIGEDDE